MRAVGDKAYRDAQNRNYRHEIASLWFVEVTAQSLAKSYGSIPGGGYLEVLAVAGHHKFLADDYLFNEGKFQNPIDWEPDTFSAVKAAYGLAKEMFQVRGWALRLKVDPCELERMLSNRDGTSNHPFDRMKEAKNALARAPGPEKASYRDLFILLKGLLMTADWMASGQHGPRVEMEASQHFLHIDPAKFLDHVKTKVESDRRRRGDETPFEGYRPFQGRCGEAGGHVLAIAPTGSGKTEAACLWALRQAERGHARKLFFLLPTMVTANSVHERLANFFMEKQGHEVRWSTQRPI